MSNLASYFPNWKTTGGLFSNLTSAPWSDFVQGSTLDAVYFGSRSGIKIPSQFLKAYSTAGVADGSTIITILYAVHKQNWERLWNTYVTEYSPLEAYKLTETYGEIKAGSVNRTKNLTETDTGTVTNQYGKQTTIDDENHEFKSAFNSSEPVPVADSEGSSTTANTGTDTRTDNLTHTNGGTDDMITGENINGTKTHTGNLGYKTQQELIKEELDLWIWNYFDRIFADVDSYLTLKVFDACQTL